MHSLKTENIAFVFKLLNIWPSVFFPLKLQYF